jgi:hypothetical protein
VKDAAFATTDDVNTSEARIDTALNVATLLRSFRKINDNSMDTWLKDILWVFFDQLLAAETRLNHKFMR